MCSVQFRTRILSWLLLVLCVSAGATKASAYSQEDVEFLARAIYVEARGEPFMGRLLVGHSIVRRSQLNRPMWGGGTIRGVVCHQTRYAGGKVVRQYSGIKNCTGSWKASDAEVWKRSLREAKLVLEGFITPQAPWRDAVYYMDPRYSSEEAKCWFTRDLVVVGWYQRHLFYREPAGAEEKKMLSEQTLSPECQARIKVAKK